MRGGDADFHDPEGELVQSGRRRTSCLLTAMMNRTKPPSTTSPAAKLMTNPKISGPNPSLRPCSTATSQVMPNAISAAGNMAVAARTSAILAHQLLWYLGTGGAGP